MSRDFFRSIEHAEIRNNPAEARDRGIRLYCTASAGTHGSDNERYALQVFAPMRLANGQEGRYMIATASLAPQDLGALRAEMLSAEERELLDAYHADPSLLAIARNRLGGAVKPKRAGKAGGR